MSEKISEYMLIILVIIAVWIIVFMFSTFLIKIFLVISTVAIIYLIVNLDRDEKRTDQDQTVNDTPWYAPLVDGIREKFDEVILVDSKE